MGSLLNKKGFNFMIQILFIVIFLCSSLISKELKEVSLQLPWKYQFQFAGYIIAKEKGFYKDGQNSTLGLNATKKFKNSLI